MLDPGNTDSISQLQRLHLVWSQPFHLSEFHSFLNNRTDRCDALDVKAELTIDSPEHWWLLSERFPLIFLEKFLDEIRMIDGLIIVDQHRAWFEVPSVK